MDKLLKEVLSFEDDSIEETDFDIDNSYSFGDYSKFKALNFSIEQAISLSGIKESRELLNNILSNERTFGVSNIENKIFAINTNSKNWGFVLFHELGHIFLKQNPSSFFEPYQITLLKDVEADLFAYLCFKKLNLKSLDNFALAGNWIKNILKEQNIENYFTKEKINYIKNKSEEFIKLGRL